jgi:hypothetical protein
MPSRGRATHSIAQGLEPRCSVLARDTGRVHRRRGGRDSRQLSHGRRRRGEPGQRRCRRGDRWRAGSGGSTGGEGGGITPTEDAGPPPDDSGSNGGGDGGGGNEVTDGGWVGPVVPMDCPGDPLQGWTEYEDTFRLEYPYDLMPSDRYTFENGIYTFWIYPTDKPHAKGNTTAPRIETHYTNFTTGQKMWTADVMVESAAQHTVIFQVHTTASGAGPVYLRIIDGNLEEINGSVLAKDLYGKWFNLKVAFTAPQSDAVIYINNCEKLTLKNSRPGSGTFYFKNGVYTCESSICRDHFKNVHLYQR